MCGRCGLHIAARQSLRKRRGQQRPETGSIHPWGNPKVGRSLRRRCGWLLTAKGAAAFVHRTHSREATCAMLYTHVPREWQSPIRGCRQHRARTASIHPWGNPSVGRGLRRCCLLIALEVGTASGHRPVSHLAIAGDPRPSGHATDSAGDPRPLVRTASVHRPVSHLAFPLYTLTSHFATLSPL